MLLDIQSYPFLPGSNSPLHSPGAPNTPVGVMAGGVPDPHIFRDDRCSVLPREFAVIHKLSSSPYVRMYAKWQKFPI